jgi:hypothetical protein
MAKTDTTGMTKDEKIVYEAKERFRRAEEWEQEARNNFVFDMKFANADSQNMYQWPTEISNDRTSSNRPCLTINKTKQHCLQIINDQRQNQSQIEIRPVGNGASYEAAAIFEGIIRHIEFESNAQTAYNNACYNQVIAGIGYWRVVTEYASPDSFEQDIFIRRVQDSLSVYIDPDISEADGSDARYAMVFNDVPREDYEAEYGDVDEVTTESSSPFGFDSHHYDNWDTKDHVRICEYFRKRMISDKLHELDNGSTVKESEAKKAGLLDTLQEHTMRSREVETPIIEWFLIAGKKIVDRKIFPGKYIPIVRVIGEETIIDKRLDRRGHTRCLIDPQRIYNYWSSSAVEFVALQSKIPYLTAIEAIRGFEDNWATANVDNKAYLPYNGIGEDGSPLPKPERAPPPVMSQAYLDGLKLAASEMMMVTGQYEANMGMKSNEVSGTAVDARQRQGENATYHFIDRFSQAIRFTGRIILDLIPLIYDTARVVKILAINGDQRSIHVDPSAPEAHQQLQDPDDPTYNAENIAGIFNPNVGKYDVEATIGPAFETRRQETFNAISQILKVNENLTPIIGDLLFKAADFPMATEIAERLHNMVPPQALGQTQPDQKLVEAQQQLAQQHQLLTKLSQELKKAQDKAEDLAHQKEIDQYNAETNRMKAVGAIDPEAMMPVIRQLVSEALGTPINPIIAAHKLENSLMPQTPAAPPSQIPAPAPQTPPQSE